MTRLDEIEARLDAAIAEVNEPYREFFAEAGDVWTKVPDLRYLLDVARAAKPVAKWRTEGMPTPAMLDALRDALEGKA